jgi:hypothetical protein
MAAAQKAQVMIATYQFNNSGYHELDVKLNAGEFVPGALGSVRRGRIAVQSTMWPHDLQADASALANKMVQLEGALRDEDVPTAAPLAKEMHEMYHGLSDKAYAWLSGAAPAEHGH